MVIHMAEVTFDKLITDTHNIVRRMLRANIPKSKIRHIDGGYSSELKAGVEYPHVQVVDPDSDDDMTNHCLDFTTLDDIPIEIILRVYALSAINRREIVDLLRYTVMRNLKTSQVTDYSSLNSYGLTSPTFSTNHSAPSLIPDDDAGRYQYITEVVVTFHWSGASV